MKDLVSSISDMTYSYNNTVVPKEHYVKVLSTEPEELMSSDIIIEINLLKPYLKIFTYIKMKNP